MRQSHFCTCIKEFFNKVSTPVNKTSYRWKDSFSFLSCVTLTSLYILRCLSLLQWIKLIVRREKREDDESKRPNVPPIVVELYYLILSAGFLCLAIWQQRIPSCWDCTIRIASIFFLAESVIWVLYYFFFRRFFEEKYAIMHTLEYIVTFPFVIILQACCLDLCTDLGAVTVASMLINPDKDTPLPILIISVIYTAVILGLIISNLPTENIKEKGDYRYHLAIIGCGEVVSGRLLKAINQYVQKEENYKNVIIYDDSEKKIKSIDETVPSKLDLQKFQIKYAEKKEMDLFRKRILASNILWIATPPFAHMRYLEPYYNRLKMVVVEKPITVFRNELDLFRMIHSSNDNIFCLSYYYLEKALPLTYLYRPLQFYEKYLSVNESNHKDIIASFNHLGSLESIRLFIHERKDERGWSYDEQTGGQLYETFIHLLVITRLVLGEPLPHRSLEWKNYGKKSGKINRITANGEMSGVKVSLELKKEVQDEKPVKRGGELQYKNGKITVDFEKMNLTMSLDQRKYIIEMDKEYKDSKYYIQLDMVSRCFTDHIKPSTVDGSYLQIECLQWLMDE